MIEHVTFRESKLFLSKLFDSMTPGVFIVDRQMSVQHFNRSFADIFNLKTKVFLGEKCGNLLGCVYANNENRKCEHTSKCKDCILRQAVYDSFSLKDDVQSGILERDFIIDGTISSYCFHYTAQTFMFQARKFVVIVLDDITDEQKHRKDLERANKKLEELNEFKNSILGMAAHDLRNPISTIQLYTDFLLNPPVQVDEQKNRAFLQRINDSSRFTLRLLNELLDLSCIESGELKINKETVLYSQFIEQTVELNRLIASQKDISIVVSSDLEFPLLIDRGKIEQVFTNLLSNAIKFSPQGTKITVSVSIENDWICTKVKDEGPGIPEVDQKLLFTQFGRTSVLATAGEKSTGLGLSISKKIMLAHGGKIGFETTFGIGSTFYFLIKNE